MRRHPPHNDELPDACVASGSSVFIRVLNVGYLLEVPPPIGTATFPQE